MYDRELTQLISTAQYYLDAAELLHLPDHELARTVSTDSNRWSADRLPHLLRLLDIYSAHLASPNETRERPFAGMHWPNSRSRRLAASSGSGIRRLPKRLQGGEDA
jgi:hypothetical protein